MSGSQCGISIYQFVLNLPRSVGGRVVNNESKPGDVSDVDFGVSAMTDWRWILNIEDLIKKGLKGQFIVSLSREKIVKSLGCIKPESCFYKMEILI